MEDDVIVWLQLCLECTRPWTKPMKASNHSNCLFMGGWLSVELTCPFNVPTICSTRHNANMLLRRYPSRVYQSFDPFRVLSGRGTWWISVGKLCVLMSILPRNRREFTRSIGLFETCFRTEWEHRKCANQIRRSSSTSRTNRKDNQRLHLLSVHARLVFRLVRSCEHPRTHFGHG